MNMEESKQYPFRFSCIMAVYNVEEYLEEAIDSVIKQNIGFEKYVQLILVDDGSPDQAGAICDRYAQQYPNNITVIHKENGGVSSARNAGLEIASGEFVNFIDADDKFSGDVLSKVYDYFQLVKTKVDVVTIPIYFFDDKTGAHVLNDKFSKGTRIINLNIEYKSVLLASNASFYTFESIQTCTFQIGMPFGEDIRWNYGLFLKNPYIGVLSNTKYLYRKRVSTTNLSAVQGRDSRYENYLPYLEQLPIYLISLYQNDWNYIPKFLQYALMYEIQWRLKNPLILTDVLCKEEIHIYIERLIFILSFIDDHIIMEQKYIYKEYKTHALNLKHGTIPSFDIREKDILLYYKNVELQWLSNIPVKIHILEAEENYVKLCGTLDIYSCLKSNTHATILKTQFREYPCEMDSEFMPANYSLGIPTLYRIKFTGKIPYSDLQKNTMLNIIHQMNDCTIIKKNISFTNCFPLTKSYRNSYCKLGNFKVTSKGHQLLFQQTRSLTWLKQELKFLKELFQSKKKTDRKAFYARILVTVLKFIYKKQIWLVSDRISKAGDNGEAFFHYAQSVTKKHPNIKVYFVIDSNSNDSESLSKVGTIIPYLSHKHKILHLMANAIISSHADSFMTNPFGRLAAPYQDILAQKKFVFLQHGITKDDASSWLHRDNKNIKGFITAAIPEHKSIVTGKYAYTPHNVWLTGFPRFDLLTHNEKRYITIMPTWRKYLFSNLDSKTGIWSPSPNFKTSSFFIFYNELINHPKLLNACVAKQYQLLFLPHPIIIPHIDFFTKNQYVTFGSIQTAYKTVYAESNLVLTDYSSSVFDFAYMRKPVIYAHFDYEEFFAGEHTYTKGYFDYEHDGFGEVTYDLESTVDMIISYIENDCQLKDKYRERIDQFFAYSDKNNCKRVYEKILELTQKEQ